MTDFHAHVEGDAIRLRLSAVRGIVYARSGGYCERCGFPLPGQEWALHHRLMRSHGGPDAPENLLALHHECHNLGTNAVHLNPARAYEHGWLVRTGDDPAQTPVTYMGAGRVLLHPDGTYTEIEGTRIHEW